MTSTDKTRQQLVDSMRKTKAAAARKTTTVKRPAPQPAKRKARPVKNAAAPVAGKHSASATGGSRSGSRDSYQAGRRVWPD